MITKKDDKPKISTTINGTGIEQVTNFTYLGQKITEDVKMEDVKRSVTQECKYCCGFLCIFPILYAIKSLMC